MAVFTAYLFRNRDIILKFDLKIRFALTYLIQTITCNIYDIAVLIDHTEAMYGYTIYITIVMAIAYATAYGGCVVFFEAVLNLLKGMGKVTTADSQARMNTSITFFTSRMMTLYAMCFVSAFVSLVGLMVPPQFCHIVIRSVFCCWNVFHIYFAICFNPPMTVIRNELKSFISQMQGEQRYNTSQFEEVSRNMFWAQVCINALFGVTAVIYLAWTVSDFLVRKTIYVILYCTIGVHVLSVPMLIALTFKSSPASEPGNTRRLPQTQKGTKCAPGEALTEENELNDDSTPDQSLRRAVIDRQNRPTIASTRHTSYYDKVLPTDSEMESEIDTEAALTTTVTFAQTLVAVQESDA